MAEFYRKKKKICQMCAGKDVDYKNIVNLIIRYSDITLESMLIIEGEVNDSDIDKIKFFFLYIFITILL